MNCDTYLSMLATLPVDELRYGDAHAHASSCRDCDRVTRVVAERERNMVLAFNEAYEPAAAAPIAARALVISHRRRIATYYRIALGIAAAATVFFFVAIRRVTPSRANETFHLQCLSPEQAAELLRPIRSPNVSISIPPNSDLGVIKVDAPFAEMNQLRAMLERYDTPAASQCGVRLPVPAVDRTR